MCDTPVTSLGSDCSCTLEKKPKTKTERDVPHIEHELNYAKAILQETSPITGDNMFDHLSEIIKRIIDEHPPNLIDYFEEYSRNVREKKFRYKSDFVKEIFENTDSYGCAQNIMKSILMLAVHCSDTLIEEETECLTIQRPLNQSENVILLQYIWSLCGLGFHCNEVYLLSCALQKLQRHPALKTVRFWGKIFGLYKNYYIAEAELCNSEIQKRLILMKDEIIERIKPVPQKCELLTIICNLMKSSKLEPGNFVKINDVQFAETIASNHKKCPCPKIADKFDIPPEPVGVGLNSTTYFVVNNLTDDWIELPYVTPKQITESLQIVKYLKGDLEADIISYPYFPGKEKHYLRALIAKISSSTYVAPNGFYMRPSQIYDSELEEEEEEETDEEEDIKKKEPSEEKGIELILNPKYKPMKVEDLQDIRTWVHIRPSISFQGRITFFDPDSALESTKPKHQVYEENEVETEDEEEEESNFFKKRSSKFFIPTVLSNCGDDKTTESVPPWTVRISNTLNKTNIVVIMKSNIWPGACSLAYEKFSDNIYIGWGKPYFKRNFSPKHIPFVQNEYRITPDLNEISDPTVAEEEEWRLSKLKKPKEEEPDEYVDEEDDETEEENEDDTE